MNSTRKTIGLCGMGNMGLAIAKQLSAAYNVIAYDLNDERRQLAGRISGVRPVEAIEDLAGTDTVVLSLPKPAVSLTVSRQLADILAPGTVVLETSTTTPRDIRECQRVLHPSGIRILDAAILSGVSQMEEGKATLLVGGAEEDIATAHDVLHRLGREVTLFGELGTGMAAKVVNNAVAHSVMVVLIEAMSLSAANGVDLGKITRMLQAPDGGLMRPLTHRVMERIATGQFDGGMPLDAARKDSTLAIELAQEAGVPLFAIQGTHTAYEIGVQLGLGRQDYSALVTLWEGWSGTQLTFAAHEQAPA